MTTDTTPRILTRDLPCGADKRWLILTLNSPGTLNALDKTSITELHAAFRTAASAPDVIGVWLEGSGEKAFCAGGDVRALYTSITEAKSSSAAFPSSIHEFFTAEYALDAFLYDFEKPIIAWASGITMGGGLGLIQGASHRIATESTLMAMPEIGIGLYPDVGATWFLNRLSPALAKCLGMTGARLTATDAKEVGWVNHIVQSSHKQAIQDSIAIQRWHSNGLLDRLIVDGILEGIQWLQSPSVMPSALSASQTWIENVFGENSVNEILQAAHTLPATLSFETESLKNLEKGCPASILVAFEQVHRFSGVTRAQAFEMELALSCAMTARADFAEGVRAMLIDRDRNPKWSPAVFDLNLFTEIKSVLDSASPL